MTTYDEHYSKLSFDQLNQEFTSIMNSNVSDADSGQRLLAIQKAKNNLSTAQAPTTEEQAAASKDANDAKHTKDIADFKQKISDAEAAGDTESANRLKMALEDATKNAADAKLKTTAANIRNKKQWEAEETADAEIATLNMLMQGMAAGSVEAATATKQLNELTGKRARMKQQHTVSSQLPFSQEELNAAQTQIDAESAA